MALEDYNTPKLVGLWDQLKALFKEIMLEMQAINDVKAANSIEDTDRGVVPEWFYKVCVHVVEQDQPYKEKTQ